ncbi:MAG: DUF4367 domain-containing protein [Ruminococcus sp.]|nr:DUF4367 domain-containing protein [Ruminococcus sp.]
MAETNMYDDILRQAFCEYMDERLESDIYREEEFETSESFEKKMTKMIKSQHNVYHKLTLTRARKVLCVAAIIVALLLSSLSVGAVREIVANLFVKHYSDHDKLTANKEEGTYPTELETLYELPYIPEGYELADESVTDKDATYLYFREEEPLLFDQTTKDIYRTSIDNEYTIQTTEVYNGQDYYVNEHKDGSYTFIWDNGEYIFALTSYLPKETIVDLCTSLKVKSE